MRLLMPLIFLVAAIVGLMWAGEYGYGPIVITREDQYKVIVGLNGPRAVLTEPGWDPTVWKIPFADEVREFDARLHYLNVPPDRVVIANGEKLIIDYYAIWRISDPLLFMRNYPVKERAEHQIADVVKSLVGARIGVLNLAQLLARAEILSRLNEETTARLEGTGVEVVDVRLNRTELPPNAVGAAYAQMREQRRALSREYRAQGARGARELVAEAERQAVTILAEARAKGEMVRGDGDATATRTFAAAHQKDPEFYAFMRSLEAYKNTLNSETTMVFSPDHPFLKYLEPNFAQ
jgi:membrane protease subunit HflC